MHLVCQKNSKNILYIFLVYDYSTVVNTMEVLEQKLGKLNLRGNKLRAELTRVLTELEEVDREKPALLLGEIGKATVLFEERDKAYRDQKANPPALSPEDQKVISFYECLGEDQESRIIKTKLGVHYKKAVARKQQAQGLIEPRITAGTVVVPYQTDQAKGTYVCVTVSPQNRNQKGGVIESLVDAVTLGIESLLGQGEQLVLDEHGKFMQINLQNKDPNQVYQALMELKPEEFDRANIDYKCIRADQSNNEPEQIPTASADDPTIVYAKEAANEHHMDISTIRRAVKSGVLEPKYVITPGRGGRPKLYVTRESFSKFLAQRPIKQNGTGHT